MNEGNVRMRKSTSERRVSQITSSEDWIHESVEFNSDNDNETNATDGDPTIKPANLNTSQKTIVDDSQNTSQDEYVTIVDDSQTNATDGDPTIKPANLMQLEINQAMKTLTDFDYIVPSLNLKYQPLQESRSQLFMTPSVTISSGLDFRLFTCMKLKEESMYPGGVEIKVKVPDLLPLRVVNSGESIWISKIGQRKGDCDIFFVGDRVISVDNKEIFNTQAYKNIITSATKDQTLKFRLCRLPFAKIFSIEPRSYKLYFSFDEECQEFILNNADTKWVITGINGVNINGISTENQLKSYFLQSEDQYVTVIMHQLNFLVDLNIKSN